MSKYYKNLTVWVTGASGGLGEALSIELARRGARLILSGRNEDKLNQVKKRCKHAKKHYVVAFDILDEEQSKAAYDSIKAKSLTVDMLINNAGVSQRSLIMETSEDVERRLMEIDYFAQTRLTRVILPDMIAQGGGKVVMISSVAGLLGPQYRGAYSAAKAAIHMWANSLRAELHAQNITVATVFPGFIKTNVSINSLVGNGSTLGTMDKATNNGMTAKAFAKKTLNAIAAGDEYIIVAGQKEKAALLVNRVSPTRLYQLIRKATVR